MASLLMYHFEAAHSTTSERSPGGSVPNRFTLIRHWLRTISRTLRRRRRKCGGRRSARRERDGRACEPAIGAVGAEIASVILGARSAVVAITIAIIMARVIATATTVVVFTLSARYTGVRGRRHVVAPPSALLDACIAFGRLAEGEAPDKVNQQSRETHAADKTGAGFVRHAWVARRGRRDGCLGSLSSVRRATRDARAD